MEFLNSVFVHIRVDWRIFRGLDESVGGRRMGKGQWEFGWEVVSGGGGRAGG